MRWWLARWIVPVVQVEVEVELLTFGKSVEEKLEW